MLRQRIQSKASRIIRKFPMLVRHSLYAAFDAWPEAKRLSASWRAIPVYCLSLPSATRRREIILRQIDRLGISRFEFIEPPDLSTTTREELEARGWYDGAETLRHHEQHLSLSEISCSLGHARMYQRIIDAGDSIAMIIEDDALFAGKRFDRVEPADFPADFDVMLINSFRSVEQPSDRVNGLIHGVESYTGSSGAYLVTAEAAKKLASIATPVVHAADGLLGRNMEWSGPGEHPFKQRGARTTIRAYLTAPDLVHNGSERYYYRSLLKVK